MTMNIFRLIDKKLGIEPNFYEMNFEAYDVKETLIDTGILVNEDIENIREILNNSKIATINFTIKYAHNSLCGGNEILVDYFIKDTINEMIQNSNHFNMTRKHKKQLQKLMLGY